MSNEKITALARAVATGKADAQKLAQEAVSAQIAPAEILKDALIPAMKTVGEGMKEEEYAFPEIQSAVKALQSVLDILRPAFEGASSSAEIPKWEGAGELYELGGHLLTFLDKGAGLRGYDLILFFDECIRGLLEQVALPCHKQAASTHK
ncbi:MAG: B12-binding domain-containing protein [Proteobacteria bacterium]|nr:B12-binding domain-containing protein [Pseudomonadota bacterium]MBU1712466.1 B12-binding domain-containing protein [Pseudomonadota bacterium]